MWYLKSLWTVLSGVCLIKILSDSWVTGQSSVKIYSDFMYVSAKSLQLLLYSSDFDKTWYVYLLGYTTSVLSLVLKFDPKWKEQTEWGKLGRISNAISTLFMN